MLVEGLKGAAPYISSFDCHNMKGADGCNVHVVGGAATGCIPEWSLVVGIAQVYAHGIT